ncbi:MAG: DUF4193 family protein [Mycobacterium sp.]
MTVDYDARRRAPAEDEPLDELARPPTAVLDSEETDFFELPAGDLFDEELVVRVEPKRPDEFTCGSCFLVHHKSRLARGRNGQSICTDCA